MELNSTLPLGLRLDVEKCSRACLSLETELRLSLRRAKSAGGSQYGKVWLMNSSEVASAVRGLSVACRKALEKNRG